MPEGRTPKAFGGNPDAFGAALPLQVMNREFGILFLFQATFDFRASPSEETFFFATIASWPPSRFFVVV
jgi:hypothetical protein